MNIDSIVKIALKEDIPQKDITSIAVFGNGGGIKEGIITARQNLVLSGLSAAQKVFHAVSGNTRFVKFFRDGDFVKKGKAIARVKGFVSDILAAERTALNFLSHLSGIATLTQKFVACVKPHHCRIMDTRKTVPGLRELEKTAVFHGGGENHRMNLSDGYLVKDNHISACGGVKEAIRRVKAAKGPTIRKKIIEIEAKKLSEVREAVEEGVDIILLDNMTVGQVRKAVEMVGGRCLIEVSGNVNLKTVRKIAETGVSRISIGALTHSAPAVDISLEIVAEGKLLS